MRLEQLADRNVFLIDLLDMVLSHHDRPYHAVEARANRFVHLRQNVVAAHFDDGAMQ